MFKIMTLATLVAATPIAASAQDVVKQMCSQEPYGMSESGYLAFKGSFGNFVFGDDPISIAKFLSSVCGAKHGEPQEAAVLHNIGITDDQIGATDEDQLAVKVIVGIYNKMHGTNLQ